MKIVRAGGRTSATLPAEARNIEQDVASPDRPRPAQARVWIDERRCGRRCSRGTRAVGDFVDAAAGIIRLG